MAVILNPNAKLFFQNIYSLSESYLILNMTSKSLLLRLFLFVKVRENIEKNRTYNVSYSVVNQIPNPLLTQLSYLYKYLYSFVDKSAV